MSQTPHSVMMFAAGFGTRMGALTAACPKPLNPVAGVPLIDRTLSLLQVVNPRKIVVNLHYRPDQIRHHLSGQNIEYSLEQPDILETGGGLRRALPLLGDDPVFTTNTDAIWSGPNPFELALAQWNPAKMDALVVCVAPDRAVGHAGAGDFLLDTHGCITRGHGYIYGGVQILKTDMLQDIPDKSFSLNVVWDRMIRDRRLFGVTYPGSWCDVGSPKGIQMAETLLQSHHV